MWPAIDFISVKLPVKSTVWRPQRELFVSFEASPIHGTVFFFFDTQKYTSHKSR